MKLTANSKQLTAMKRRKPPFSYIFTLIKHTYARLSETDKFMYFPVFQMTANDLLCVAVIGIRSDAFASG